jgi:hypothetical protein
VWDAQLPATKIWPAWKQWARETQLTIDREQLASGGLGDTFGSASAAIRYHRPNPSASGFADGAFCSPTSPSFEEQFT